MVEISGREGGMLLVAGRSREITARLHDSEFSRHGPGDLLDFGPIDGREAVSGGFEGGDNRAGVASLRRAIRAVILPLRGGGRYPAPLRLKSSAGRAPGDHDLDAAILLPAGLGPF